MNLNTCRICKLTNFDHSEALLKYGVRHYAHGSCLHNRFGLEFLNMIPKHTIGYLPFRMVVQFGIVDEVLKRTEE